MGDVIKVDQSMLEKRIQQRINLSYKVTMGVLSVVVLISPLFCLPAGVAAGVAMIFVSGVHYLDKRSNYEFGRWLAGLVDMIKQKTSSMEDIPVVYTQLSELNKALKEKRYYSTLLRSTSSDEFQLKKSEGDAGKPNLLTSKSTGTLFANPTLPSKREPKEAVDRLAKSLKG